MRFSTVLLPVALVASLAAPAFSKSIFAREPELIMDRSLESALARRLPSSADILRKKDIIVKRVSQALQTRGTNGMFKRDTEFVGRSNEHWHDVAGREFMTRDEAMEQVKRQRARRSMIEEEKRASEVEQRSEEDILSDIVARAVLESLD